MSPSVARKSLSGRRSSRRSASRERDYGSPHKREKSPLMHTHSRSPSRRGGSPVHHKSSHRERGSSPARDRHSPRNKSAKQEKESSPISRSPSPRTKRLRRIRAEREHEKLSETDHIRNHDRRSDKPMHERSHREGTLEKEHLKDRREPRSGKQSDKDEAAAGSSRSKHRHSLSPPPHRLHRNQQYSRSPPPASHSRARDEGMNSRRSDHRDDTSDSLLKMKATEEVLETKEKQKPSFELSGKLAEETNRVRGVTLLFTEPPDARKPDVRWRLYVFKGGEMLNEPLYVHRQSCYLFGRERRVADIPTDHPSCSKQHAVLQFRQVEKEQPNGMTSKQVRPYLMDLGSTNKTFVNDNPIEPQCYFELFEKDTVRFGNSSREYVLLHENSAT